MEKLTIITINYNNAKGLRKTIPSVLNQRGIPSDKFEYIIVDGGSCDESVQVIKDFVNQDTFCHKISKWISEKDSGIYNAMNKGIKMASGTLIALLNSGDEALSDAYEDLLRIHRENPDAILYGAMNMMNHGKLEKVYGFGADSLESSMIAHPASFVPKKVYDEVGLYDESFKSSGDWDLFIKFYRAKVPFLYTGKIYVNFDTGGISNSNERLVIKEDKRIIKKYNLKTKKQRLMEIYRIISLIIPGIIMIPAKRIAGKIVNHSRK